MMSRSTPAASPAPTARGRRLPLVMALACGVTVANAYFPQAITPLIARSLEVSDGTAATLATLTQLGYAVGIFLLVPLGDRLPRRPLITVLLVVTSLALLIAGLAPGTGLLLAAGTLVGLATVVPQILLPMAAGLVEPERRGRVIGTLQAGLIGGILLARAFGGVLGEHLGWRAPYLVAAVLTALLAVVLCAILPTTVPAVRDGYPELLADTLRMLHREKELHRSVVFQITLFGGFSAAWTAVALLITGPRYDMGTQAVGVLALVGAGAMFLAPAAGNWVDRYGSDRVNLWCVAGGLAAAGVLAVGALGGTAGLVALAAGLLLIDVAVQCGQVANQARIFALRPEAHSRLNTGYMTCSFLGASAGSWLGVRAYTHFGWWAVCALIALTVASPIATYLVGGRGRRTAGTAPEIAITSEPAEPSSNPLSLRHPSEDTR